MYTTTVAYEFKTDFYQEACEIWREYIMEPARKADGLIRIQFLTAAPKAMAIGTWKHSSYAETFMKTGAAKIFFDKITPFLDNKSMPQKWELTYFNEP